MSTPNSFSKFIDAILAAEKGYVNHKNDHGGATNFGITEKVARANGYLGDMKDMPEEFARVVYFKRYISEPKFDKVAEISERIGMELIDTGVNMGPARASEFFQRCLNLFNQEGARYSDLFVDGRIGGITLDALREYIAFRGDEGIEVMLCALNCEQGHRYIEIAENDPSQESFIYGWLRARVLHSDKESK